MALVACLGLAMGCKGSGDGGTGEDGGTPANADKITGEWSLKSIGNVTYPWSGTNDAGCMTDLDGELEILAKGSDNDVKYNAKFKLYAEYVCDGASSTDRPEFPTQLSIKKAGSRYKIEIDLEGHVMPGVDGDDGETESGEGEDSESESEATTANDSNEGDEGNDASTGDDGNEETSETGDDTDTGSESSESTDTGDDDTTTTEDGDEGNDDSSTETETSDGDGSETETSTGNETESGTESGDTTDTGETTGDEATESGVDEPDAVAYFGRASLTLDCQLAASTLACKSSSGPDWTFKR